MGEQEEELQKEKGSRSQPEDNEVSSSGSIGDTMRISSDPENSGSEHSSDDEFILVLLPPNFVPGHFEYLEDALMCPDLPPAYQTDDSKDKSSDDSDGDNSDDSTENHDSSSDHSDNHSHDGHANDVYSNGCVKLHQQGMHTVGSHLHNMQTELEQSCTNAVERSGRAVEPEEEEEEVHKENEASQQTEQEAPPSGSTLDDGGTMSASSDLESCESEGSPDEELLVPSLPPSFIPGQLGDFEDDLLYPRLPPVSQIPSNSESELARWEKTEQQPSFSSSCDLCLCRLI
ncbi:uncharacterized protein LOC110219759 [Phascolarctos cinereus]|uniref:Acidic repeat-containing protein-like isoform X3 n=1 Tax=Phascolarctos cinereus TaxID=38626 RepID=A0A6P5LSS1_PHACI|nr:acidic repeat-containing protein-like isoform X3 [Phascolarctos cinereus]